MREVTPVELAKIADGDEAFNAAQHNLEHVLLAKPDIEFSVQGRNPDGSYSLTSRPLQEVMAELDEMHTTGSELLACATGMMAAAG